MILLMLASLSGALADEPNIVAVAPGQTVTAQTQSYLLPASKYDACLVDALTARGVEEALQTCVSEGTHGLEESKVALEIASQQLDAAQIDLEKLNATLQLRESELHQARTQRNVAWGIAGGLILGSTTTAAIALTRSGP